MRPEIHYNDSWESIPLEFVDDVIAFFERSLQPSHPLRSFKLFPLAKCWRKHKYLIEEEKPSDNLWVLDFEKKNRIKWDYDAEADVLYISFGNPKIAEGVDIGEGTIIRIQPDSKEIVGLTILNPLSRTLSSLMGKQTLTSKKKTTALTK